MPQVPRQAVTLPSSSSDEETDDEENIDDTDDEGNNETNENLLARSILRDSSYDDTDNRRK